MYDQDSSSIFNLKEDRNGFMKNIWIGRVEDQFEEDVGRSEKSTIEDQFVPRHVPKKKREAIKKPFQ